MATSKVIKDLIRDVNKAFKTEGLVNTLEGKPMDVPVISTRIPSIDHALGVGGIPLGRITEIYGPEASGKTTLASYVIAEVQANGGIAVMLDVEHAFDKKYAKICGVDTDQLIISQPDTMETALELVEKFIDSGQVDLIVFDSVAGAVTARELDGDMGDAMMGVKARLMSQAMRKINGALSRKNKTALVFINQVRMNIGVVYGNPETTPGGKALKFHSTCRIRISKTSKQVVSLNGTDGHITNIKIHKNKVAPPFKTTSFNLYYGEGPDTIGNLAELAVKIGVIHRGGSSYSLINYETGELERIAIGKKVLSQVVANDIELQKELYKRCLDHSSQPENNTPTNINEDN